MSLAGPSIPVNPFSDIDRRTVTSPVSNDVLQHTPPSSPNRAVVALVPAEHEHWQPVLHVSNQVVLYNPRSHALSIRKSNNFSHVPRESCPYCKQTLPAGFEPELDDDDIDALDSDPAYHSRASDYFQLLAASNEASSRPSTPPPVMQEPSTSAFPAEKMAEGYFKAFFQEEMKLGMGANGSVFLCQHMLDGNPLGHFAVKKIAVGESHSYLLTILREVRLLERLHHPNIITYHHAWLESCQFSAFGPKVPTLQLSVLMQWAEGGSLDDFIDVRLGKAPQHIHIDSLAQFTFPDSSSSSTFSPARPNAPIISSLRQSSLRQEGLATGDSHSRSARIRAFRQFQRATPDERERIQREMAGARRHASWKAVHLLSAEEVKSLFQDVVTGLEFLHNKSILHLDLKPGNVLLTWDEGKLIPRAMLSDFGTSRDMLKSSRNRSGNTGTLEYTSPESLPSPLTGFLRQIDSKADMWSLGMILHKLLFFRLPYRYAAEGDANGEPISTDREGDKLDRLEKEVLSYLGLTFGGYLRFKSTPAHVTAFEARRLPKSFLVLLESLLNVNPSSRPSCERVTNAIKDGKLDPFKDDFLRANGVSSLAIRRPDSFGHPPPPPLFPGGQYSADTESESEPHRERSASVEVANEEVEEDDDGQTTPTRVSPFGMEEKTHLLGPPSPPPPLLMPKTLSLRALARGSATPLNVVPSMMWKRAFKSCVLVAKVGWVVFVVVPVDHMLMYRVLDRCLRL
ncbi:hypothetical protein C0995_013019 [Termitomyces sp. Mi166|nr:hypothetical protein C0995_013019 [Termitomyces sp. Mi166\